MLLEMQQMMSFLLLELLLCMLLGLLRMLLGLLLGLLRLLLGLLLWMLLELLLRLLLGLLRMLLGLLKPMRSERSLEDKMEDYKDLGWINNWYYEKQNPPEYDKCREAGHELEESSSSHWTCVTRQSCPICKITWRVDSSD